MDLELALEKSIGLDRRVGFEAFLWGQINHRINVFLETPFRAVEIVRDTFSHRESAFRYLETILNMAKSGQYQIRLRETLDAWISGEPKNVSRMYNLDQKDFPEFINSMVLQRNQEWIESAVPLIEEEVPTLFVVGCYHVVNNGSFLEKLNQKGYSLTKAI